MKFNICYFMRLFLNFFKAALYLAVENDNSEIVQSLLSKSEIDVNEKYIFLRS